MLRSSRLAVWLRKRELLYKITICIRRRVRRNNYPFLRTFIFFLGYPRSGSSILGSILDAHQNITMAHELNVLKFINKGFTDKQIFYLLERNARLFNKTGRKSSGYSGIIEGQLNGFSSPLLAIGDKKAGGTSLLLEQDPTLLDVLKKKISLTIKCIHIVRNPFDMITTQAYGGNEKQKRLMPEDIAKAMAFCFKKIDTVRRIIEEDKLDIYTIKLEDLIDNPEEELYKLYDWLDLEAPGSYVKACSNALFKNPHQSRLKYKWDADEQQKVQEKINETCFLSGYTFTN